MPFRLIFLSEFPTEVHAVSLQRQLLLSTDELCCGCLPVPLAQPLTIPSALGSLLCPPLPLLHALLAAKLLGLGRVGPPGSPLASGSWGTAEPPAPASWHWHPLGRWRQQRWVSWSDWCFLLVRALSFGTAACLLTCCAGGALRWESTRLWKAWLLYAFSSCMLGAVQVTCGQAGSLAFEQTPREASWS